jgi:chromate transporter
VTFVPCFLWIFVGAPYVERLRGNRALAGALSAITAAVVGVILNLAVWFALHTIFAETRSYTAGTIRLDVPVLASLNPWALALAAVAILAVFHFKVGMVQALAACAAAGIPLHLVGLV